MEDKALSTIQLCLSDCTLQEILTETKAADAWAKLEKTYMQKTVTNRLRLKQRFHSLRMTEGTPLKSHISEYTALLNDMERIGIKTDDEDKAMVLLCSLPNSYKVFKETILHSRDSLTFYDVKNNLLIKSDIDLDSTKAGSSHQDVGLIVERGRQKEKSHHINKSRSRSKHRNLTCNYCKKMGHIKADCFKLKNKQQASQKDVSTEEANVAESESEGDLLIVSNRNDKFETHWVMDTWASQHMTPKREWFATYETCDGGYSQKSND